MRKNTKLIGSIAVVVAAVLWSLDGLLRSKLYSLPPLTLIFAEHLVGTMFVAPFLIANYKKIKPLTKSQLWTLLGVGVVSSLLGTLLFTAAFFKVNFANFSVVVLSQQLQPVFAILTASFLLKEKVDRKFIMFAAAGIAGVYMLNFPNLTVNFNTGDATSMAGLMAIGSAICWGAGTAFSKYSLKNTYWLQITFGRFLVATVFAGLGVLLFGQTTAASSITGEQWKYLAIIASSTGLVALGIYYFGLQKIRASRATILELVWPLSAVIIGVFNF